jgi:CubicO group peptidase (beta-lactamase class C family)
MKRKLGIIAAIAFAFASSAAFAEENADELMGLWAYETTFGTPLGGELKLERDGEAWNATIAGDVGDCSGASDAINCAFANGAGKFRGALAKNGKTIDGYWLCAPVTEDPRGGASQAFATPLILERSGKIWRGDVVPLVDRFRLYLKVYHNEDGKLVGAFRDPDTNEIGAASRFFVGRSGDNVSFGLPDEAGKVETMFRGRLDGDSLKIDYPAMGREIVLGRAAPDATSGYLPRMPDAPASYKKPEDIGDGWKMARASEVGIDEAALERVIQKIAASDPSARRPSLIHSILIARRGKLVFEEYFFGFDRETPHDTRSAGKTFSSVMLGAAMMEGVDISPESKIYEIMAGRGPFQNPDPRKEKITLAHLMTHTSGLDCNDNDETSLGNEDTYLQNQHDRAKYTLDLPMKHEPGTRYAYCSASINLVGAAIAEATKTWLPEYFDRTVAKKLGFGRYYWNLTPNDDGYLGGGSWLRSRDLLKVGQAYLDGGAWRGQRIVPEAWVTQSTAARFAVTPETTGYSEEEFGNYYGRGEDALAWHLGRLKVGERSFRTYMATGNGGQVLIVAPELDLVVVFTGGNYRQGGIWGRWGDEILGAEIVATMKK